MIINITSSLYRSLENEMKSPSSQQRSDVISHILYSAIQPILSRCIVAS